MTDGDRNLYDVVWTSKFKKDYKALKKRHLDMNMLYAVIERLANNRQLDAACRDHTLAGAWRGYRECHVQPDWLLIYRIESDVLLLTLTRTGTHDELFGR